MNWANPRWLGLLAFAPLLWMVFRRGLEQRQKRLKKFADARHWPLIAPEIDFNRLKRKANAWLLAFVFLVLAMARPQFGVLEETVKIAGLDLMVVFDVSNSMLTEDVAPNRLKRARYFVHSLVDRLDGDRVGIIAFAASAYLACPLTTDLDYVRDSLEILDPKSVSSQGTDIGNAVDTAFRALDRGAEEEPGGGTKTGSRVILLVTDGEDQEKIAADAAERLKAQGIRLYVFGVGTADGAPIPLRDEGGLLHGYKKGPSGETVLSKMDSSSLEKLASSGGGRYWTVSDTGRELNELMADLGALARGDLTEKKITTQQERFQIPLGLGLLVLFLELLLSVKKPARSSRLSFNRLGTGVLASGKKLAGVLVLAGASLFLNSSRAQAADGAAPVDAYQKNESALKDFEEGKWDQAKGKFDDAQARHPESPELRFNEGSIAMKSEKLDEASEQFEKAGREAEKRNQPELAGQAYFNQGTALMQKKDTAKAIPAFIDALEQARSAGDKALEADARKNLELMLRQQAQGGEGKDGKPQDSKSSNPNQDQKGQSDQDQKNKNNSKDPNAKDKKDQSDSKNDSKKDENKDGKGDQEKNQQDPQVSKGHGYHSKQLSKDAAEQVMKELSRREKELQQKLSRQKGAPARSDRDW